MHINIDAYYQDNTEENAKFYASVRRWSAHNAGRLLVIVTTYGGPVRGEAWRAEFYDTLPEAQDALRRNPQAVCIVRNGVVLVTKAQHEDAAPVMGGGNPDATFEAEETADDEIALIVHRIRQYQEQAEEAAVRISEAKDRLEVLLKERGTNWSDDDGYARLTAPGVRVSYSRIDLDELIIEDPLQYGWLKHYRHESPLAARVMVK